MPILLTTPINHDAEHNSAAESYVHVKIDDIRHRVSRRILVLTLVYGNKAADGSWTAGKTAPRVIRIENKPPEPGPPPVPADLVYDDLMANTFATSTSNPLYAENAAALYTWLLNTDDPSKAAGVKYYQGTVV